MNRVDYYKGSQKNSMIKNTSKSNIKSKDEKTIKRYNDFNKNSRKELNFHTCLAQETQSACFDIDL